jgi:hypothetical protein
MTDRGSDDSAKPVVLAEAEWALLVQRARVPNIESIHRDIALANSYRQEFIKSLILIAGGLFAFSVSFRPELRAVVDEELFSIAWIGLTASMVGGFVQLASWERFYASYQRYEWKGKDGKQYRHFITVARRVALLLQIFGFIVGVAALGSFTAINLGNVEKAQHTSNPSSLPSSTHP